MRLTHIEYRLNQQQNYIEFITEAYQNLIRTENQPITRNRVVTRLQAVKEQWEKFDVANKAITLAVSQLTSSDRRLIRQRSYFRNDKYRQTYEVYLETLERMNALLTDHPDVETRPQSSTSISHSVTHAPILQGPRLPRIDVPKFNGNLSDWLPFRDLFSSLILINPIISPVEKLQYLKTSLTGSASHLLKNTALIADNFQKSWDALTSFYENKRLLVNSALQSLLSIRRMSSESASEIESLYTSIMQAYRTLETLERSIQSWDDFLVFLTVQRLDPESVKSWENFLGASKEPPTWEQIREFLLTRMLALQAVEKSQANQLPLHSRPPARAHFLGQMSDAPRSSTRKNSCVLCSSNHYLGNCLQYQQKSPANRQSFVLKNNCCVNCLGSHHISKCTSTKRCFQCGKRHHTSLHIVTEAGASQSHLIGVNQRTDEQGLTSTSASKTIHHTRPDVKSQGLTTLLATAQVRVRNSHGDTVKIRALLDQGSEISLITESVVRHLSLPRQATSLPILGIGAHPSCRTKGLAMIEITPHFDPTTTLTLKAHILPKLTAVIPSSTLKPSEWPHLQNLQLADPTFTKSGKIDLLIGADLYGHILEGSIVKGVEQTPTAQLTTLGWIVSGPVSTQLLCPDPQSFHCTVDHDLHALLERFWHQEEISPANNKTLTDEDQACEDHFLSTHSRNHD